MARRLSLAPFTVKPPLERKPGAALSDILVYLARTSKFGERNSSRKLAMIALCNAANDEGDAFVMGAAEIAEAAELVDVKSAMRVRKELVAIGLIEPAVEDRDAFKAGHGRGAKGRYRINVARLRALHDGEWDYPTAVVDIRATLKSATGKRVASGHPKQSDAVAPGHPNDNSRVASGHPSDHPKKGGPKGGPLGGLKGGLPPHTPLTVGEVSNNLSPPLTPPSGESERESERGFAEILQELRSAKPACQRAIDNLIEPLLRQRKLHGAPDPVFALGIIAEWAEKHGDDVLADALQRVKDERGFSFKPADLEQAMKAAIAHAKRTAPLHRRATPAQIADADPTIVAKGAEVREALRKRLGNEVFTSWFSGIEFERLAERCLVASVGVRFVKTYIEQHFASDIEACARAVVPGAERVSIIVRRQPERQSA